MSDRHKPLVEYPEWRKKQCVHCAAGEPMGAMVGYHWTGNPDPPKCTAQSADEYIAELERRLAEAERKARAFDGMVENNWRVSDEYILPGSVNGPYKTVKIWINDEGDDIHGTGSTPLLSVENAMERQA